MSKPVIEVRTLAVAATSSGYLAAGESRCGLFRLNEDGRTTSQHRVPLG